MDPRKVEILNTKAGEEGECLHYVHDAIHNRYFLPFESDPQPRKSIEMVIKEIAKQDQMKRPDFSETAFDQEWPELLASLYRIPSEREGPNTPLTAIIDTGLMHEHPFIQGCIVEEKDFTGEGPEDLHGHGTICALISRMTAPYFKSRFMNLKAAEKDGYGAPERLIAAFQYLIEYKQKHPQERIIANVSLGVYSMKWGGLINCHGDCEVCRAAVEVAQQDIFLMIAAGNEPGIPTCPAKIGLMKKYASLPVMAVTAYDFQAARGSIAAPGTYKFVPLDG